MTMARVREVSIGYSFARDVVVIDSNEPLLVSISFWTFSQDGCGCVFVGFIHCAMMNLVSDQMYGSASSRICRHVCRRPRASCVYGCGLESSTSQVHCAM